MKYPNKLRHWRELKRYSQPELAMALVNAGFPTANKQRIWKIENGERKMTPQEATALAEFLECNIEDFFEVPIYKKTKKKGTSLRPQYTPPTQDTVKSFIDLWRRAAPDERREIQAIAMASFPSSDGLPKSIPNSLKPHKGHK